MQEQERRQQTPADQTTNPAVAAKLGLSVSMVSMLRSGQRRPSVNVMRRVAGAYGWPVADQVALLPAEGAGPDKGYGLALERYITGAAK